MSAFGEWTEWAGLPAFRYVADQHRKVEAEWETFGRGRSRRHALGVGNRRLQMVVDNEGTAALFDEHQGLRWLIAADPYGSGVSRIEGDGPMWGSALADSPDRANHHRTFLPTGMMVECGSPRVRLRRAMILPEGEVSWVLVRVELTASAAVALRHVEEWALAPRFHNFGVAFGGTTENLAALRRTAERFVSYTLDGRAGSIVATEHFDPDTPAGLLSGVPVTFALEALGEDAGRAIDATVDGRHPTLRLATDLTLAAGEARVLWFRAGLCADAAPVDPPARFEATVAALRDRLPAADSARIPEAGAEVAWNAAVLTGSACADGVLGGHTLGENGSYYFSVGVNGAARDQLQYALPLIYLEPDLALSLIRNTLSWGAPDGSLPWGIDGAKRPCGLGGAYRRISDTALWALWAASEYVIATGDVASLTQPLGFHPVHGAAPVPLAEHLRRQFRYLIDVVGAGPGGHLRMLDCDWADNCLAGATAQELAAGGESVMNSAMAAYAFPLYAVLCDRTGDAATGAEARAWADRLRGAVRAEWNGRWFRRARIGDRAIGDDVLYLEAQAWCILCGAADDAMARTLLASIDTHLRRDSPLGTRQHWPRVPGEQFAVGESLGGGIWFQLEGPLIWAMTRVDSAMAVDEWQRITLRRHAAAYPAIWEGTTSGPDSYNAPESARPGRTWMHGPLGVQQYPVNNPHSHAQPLLAYLRLLGVEPLADGTLRLGGGPGSFRSRWIELNEAGGGRIDPLGPVTLTTPGGIVAGGPDGVSW